ncbi:serine/threonine-protein kinase [Ornithinimicrobium avium]|uniref:serine/threonine-protein kinase n=1 Tax=Ornithinimicrobium avium TaxID=2283195 RepID=UPI0013B4735B|nr:serine/threonine-protein kinase [Ornithinimicrobium avium]
MPDVHDEHDDPDLETTRQTPVGEDPEVVAGRYRILRTLGRGGGGIVWLALDEHLGREVALKRVSGETDAELLVTRGLREARTSATLAHDHVVRVYDAFVHEGVPWIVMEHVAGPSLSSLLEGGRSLPVATVARIGAQMATALAAAHGAGVVHRDVKPGNVLLTDDDGSDAKLTDFGIARAEEDQKLTRTGMVSGTAAYFSPEMARGEDPSPASDVWALGATLYTAVEGHRPFPDAGNAVAQLHAIARGEPTPPERAGVLAPVLRGMLDPDPATRWTADRAARALTGAARGLPADDDAQGWPGVGVAGGAAAGAAASDAGQRTAYPQGDPTQAVDAAGTTRQVPVQGETPAATAGRRPPRAAASYAGRGGALQHRRRGVRPGVVLGWLIGVLLAAALAWLVWTIAGDGPGGGTDGSSETTSSQSGSAVTADEAGQLVRTFYEALATEGLEAARGYLGPDAAVDPEIADGLTRVSWNRVDPVPQADGSVEVTTDVEYYYGDVRYAQQEVLVVARPEGGAAPLIVSRTTSDPVITTGGTDEHAGSGDAGDGDAGDGDAGSDGTGDAASAPAVDPAHAPDPADAAHPSDTRGNSGQAKNDNGKGNNGKGRGSGG